MFGQLTEEVPGIESPLIDHDKLFNVYASMRRMENLHSTMERMDEHGEVSIPFLFADEST